MEKHLFSQKLLRAYSCIIALCLGCLFPNIGYGTKNISKISLSNGFASTFKLSIGPNIVYAEYFIDDDPGFGKGISIPITAGSSIEHTFSVTMPLALSNGLHLITVRYKDASGNWSISSPRSFIKESLISTSASPNISFAEYFIDDDPGFGKGSAITLAAKSSNFEHTFSVLLPANLSEGIHVVTVRYKDDLGNWSISSPRSFLKENLISTSSLPNLVYAEYFIDDAPAFGKGTAITITSNSSFEHSVTIPLASTLSDGLHTVTVRYKDALGNWSISSPRSFLKENLISTSTSPNIVYAEYFINDDPGFGKGTAIQITASSSFEHSLTINIPSTLTDVLHLITVRYKDALGNWSISSARAFIKESPTLGMPLPELVYAEYFIDNDPGIGKGKSISFKAGQTIQNLPFDINLNNLGLANGQHFLQLRVKDVNNVWSIVGTKTFVLSNELVRISLNNIVICSSTGTIQIPYIVDGVFNANNQFKVELSDEKGDFPTSPKLIGFVTSKVNGQIPITITDVNVIDKYRIRIVSTNPVRESDPVNLMSKPLSPSISTTNSVICQGLSSVLTANACENGVVTWTGGLTGSSITVKPTKTTSYKAICTVNTCKSDSSTAVTITVTPKPAQPKITVNNATICVGGSSVLTSTACTGGTLTWTGGLTGASITVSPTATKSYKVLCTQSACKSDSSVATTITVTPKPTTPIAKSNNSSVCLGNVAVLSATGCSGVVTWTGNLAGTSVTVTPTKTSTYKALCTVNGCKSDSSTAVTITVSPKPTTPVAKSNNSSVCLGTSAVLTATACDGTVTWTGNLTGSTVTVTPTKTSTYKALCTVNGCKSDSSTAVTITVSPKPATPVAKSNNASVCLGNVAILSATGCSGVVTWTGNLTGSSVTVTPSKTSTYKALCTVNGCKSDSSTAVTITVTPKPTTPVAKSNNSSVCLGNVAVLSATGCAGTVTWTGNLTGSTVTVTPTKTSTYKALCTVNGCKSDSSTAVTITVTPKPATPVAKSNNSSVCLGTVAVLSATGCAGTVTWTNNLTGSSVTVTPTKTSTYKALCTINGCKSDSSTAVTITVTPKPVTPVAKSNNSSVCLGTSAVLSATGCTGTVTWTGNLTGSSVTVTPNKTTSYKALCTVNGCKSDSSTAVTITVTPKPSTPVAKSNNSSLCLGTSAILSATGCTGTVTWTGNLTGSSVTVTPNKTTSYKARCTVNGCKSDSSTAVTITVTPKPVTPVAKSNNSSVCLGNFAVLSATGCAGTVNWSGNLTGSSVTVTPTKTTSYKALCTVNGCKSDSNTAVTITVTPKPTTPVAKSNNSSVCLGNVAVLSATGCSGVVTWTGNLTGSSVTVTPTKTSSYKALCTINGCKSDSSTAVTITVTPKPVTPVAKSNNSSVCLGNVAVLSATGCAGTVTWTGNLTGTSVTVTPTKTSTYKALCTVNGCKSDSSTAVTVSVTPKPNAPVISSNITCAIPVSKQWDKTIKGNGSENIRVMLNLPDGGYIIGGENHSEITNSIDYWLVKIDAKGNKVWEKTFGGTKGENLASMLATADGGYVLLGISNSDISADKSEASRGTNDYWVIKINANGTKVWDKTFGGNAQDTPKSIVATSDGGFILGGQSISGLSGDKTEASKGTYDFWIVKINANGSKVWDKTFGGDNEEYLSKILITADGGYLLAGHSSSGITGNKSETSKGASDYWIVKINATGSKVWDKAFGGNSVEYLGDISTTSDGGFLLVGDSYSGLSGDKTAPSKGDTDYWAVRINANGLKIWDKTFGGNSTEYFKAIANTNDGGFILAGYSFSGISGDKSEATNGNSDYWAIQIDGNGVKVWDKAFGGNSHDYLSTIILTNDGGFLLGGSSRSGLSGDKTDVGTQYQYCWIVKASVCNPNNISSSQKPTLTASGCTDTVTWSNGATGNSITISPSTATTYTATCTVNGCISSASNAITVSVTVTKPTTPTITASNVTICTGTNATLTASACTGGTLTWTGGLTGNSITVSPTATKTYKVVCSQNGISSDSSTAATVTVNPKPTQPKITVSNATICVGGSAVLTASACTNGTVTWTAGLTGASITVSPTATKSYKAICAINGCKSDSSLATTVTVLVKPNPPTITSKSTTVSSVVKQWEKTYGGNWYDNLSCVVPTQDGGYLLGGNSTSTTISGDKSEDIVGGWIVKINADGNKIWDKAYKGIFLAANGGIGLRSMIPTSDGGFLLGTTSITNTGAIDFWIIKIDANGNKVWDKTFGGMAEDYLVKIISTSDGGFLIGGSSLSTGTNGYLDYLVIKVDVNGNKQWTKFYGAAGHETLSSIIKTSDGGYLLAGDSHSNIGGDKSENSKGLYSSDYWIVKIDANGTKIWDKTLGGDNYDASPDVVQTSDGGFLLGGSSRSSISGDKSENYRGDIGYDDFWIIKLDSKGTKIWDKTFGGSMNDKLIKIMTTPDGGFLLGGSSYSGISLDKSEETQGHWLIKIDANGKKVWDKTFGGIGTDPGIYDISPTSDGGYIFGGSSKSSNRQMDYWIIKIKENKTTTTTLTATGCSGTVTWSNGAKANAITVSPSTATTYTATCTVNACVSSASNAIKVSPDAIIPNGGSAYDAARIEAPTIEPKINGHKVFPNPAITELNIETDLEGESTFQLYDLLGRKVAETTFIKKTKILVGDIGRGNHFYSIQNQGIRQDGKVLLE